MRSVYPKHKFPLRRASILILVLLVSLVVLIPVFQVRGFRCARYESVIQWISAYVLPVERVAVPSAVQSCLSGRNALVPAPMLLPETDGVAVLLALESVRPEVILAGQGIVWDGVLGHPWFQAHYFPVSRVSTEDDLVSESVFAYRPATGDAGDLHRIEGGGTSTTFPSLWGFRLESPFITPEDRFSISFYWQDGSDTLALEAPAPGYRLRVQLLAEDSGMIWSQVSQPLMLDMQPVEGRLRLVSPQLQLPADLMAPTGPLILVAHLLHPDGRELPLFSGDSLAKLTYLTDFQFTPFPEVGQTGWHLGADNVSESIALAGSDWPSYTFSGGKVKVVLVWQALSTLGQDYKVFVHLVDDKDGNELMIAQADAQPAAWRVPTSSWTEGMYVRDVHWLTLPPDTSRGEYLIYVGLYHVETGERLWVVRPGADSPLSDRIPLGSLWVR